MPFFLKQPFKSVGICCLLSIVALSGCSSLQFGELFKPINVDKLSSYEQKRLRCSIQTGLQSETDYTILGSGIVSLGFRLPSSADKDMNYDRRFDEYHDCLRVAGL